MIDHGQEILFVGPDDGNTVGRIPEIFQRRRPRFTRGRVENQPHAVCFKAKAVGVLESFVQISTRWDVCQV